MPSESAKTEKLTYQRLKEAVSGGTIAFRRRQRLQPAGGPGTKVFPPTYSGAVYATEKRRLPGREEPVDCVLLDSVQSQANRMEEALQTACDEGRFEDIGLPVVVVDFTEYGPGKEKSDELQLLDEFMIGPASNTLSIWTDLVIN